jgi:hypothetical protein
MKKILRFFAYLIGSIISLLILVVIGWILACYMYGDADFKEDTTISLTISAAETPKGTISGILRSPDDLERYLLKRQRPYYHHLPFEGNLNIDSFDFENYDYIFCEGRPILRLVKLFWDSCSSYDHEKLIPVASIRGEEISHKVYIYKITPKNKYRTACP